METIINDIFKLDTLWNTKKKRNFVWGRMIFVYYNIYVQKNRIDDLIKSGLLSTNQIYYLMRKSKYNMEKNQYFKYFYLIFLREMIERNYKISFFVPKI